MSSTCDIAVLYTPKIVFYWTTFYQDWNCITVFMTAQYDHINGSVQDCSNSSVLAMALLQSCTKPSIWTPWIQLINLKETSQMYKLLPLRKWVHPFKPLSQYY